MFQATAAGEHYRFPASQPSWPPQRRFAPATSSPDSRPLRRACVAAQFALADLPLTAFLTDTVIPYEVDDVTRLIVDSHDPAAFAAIGHLTVGGLRDHFLSDATTAQSLAALAPGLTPEMVAAVSKICRLQDLILIARKPQVTTAFRTTIGPPAASPPGSNPTIPATTRLASRPPSSTVSCSAPVTPASASTRRRTRRTAPTRCSACSTTSASASTFRCSPACSPT